MSKKNNDIFFNFLTFCIITTILILSKLVYRPPNFSPLIAVIMLTSYLIANKTILISIILSALIVSDNFLGFYQGFSVTYLTLIMIALTLPKIFIRIDYSNLLLMCVLASFLFFAFTNPLHFIFDNNLKFDFKEILTIYKSGLEFFPNTLFSTILFSYIMVFLIKKIIQINDNKNLKLVIYFKNFFSA